MGSDRGTVPEARLDVDMHPRIAQDARSLFLLGRYEFAALAAMREVEIRVRELAGTVADDDQNIGVSSGMGPPFSLSSAA